MPDLAFARKLIWSGRKSRYGFAIWHGISDTSDRTTCGIRLKSPETREFTVREWQRDRGSWPCDKCADLGVFEMGQVWA